MKKLTVLFLTFFPFFVFSQYSYFTTSSEGQNGEVGVLCTKCEVEGLTPAPCSIEGYARSMPVYLVRVGVYQRELQNLHPNIFVLQIGEYFHYFLDVEYYSIETARAAALQARKNGFCDALPVVHPFNKKVFK